MKKVLEALIYSNKKCLRSKTGEMQIIAAGIFSQFCTYSYSLVSNII